MLPLLLSCTTPPPQHTAGPHLILISLDTVRADHLGVYGYDQPTSPRLDAFAETADIFTSATAAAPWTLPSHAAMFTGLLPAMHGAVTDTPQEAGGSGGDALALSDAHITLAETLAAAGYQTAGFVANGGYLSEAYNLHQGFARYTVQSGPGVRLNAQVAGWLDTEARTDRPLFLFLNYMDAHRPYNTAPLPGWPAPEDPDVLGPLNALIAQVMIRGEPPDPTLRATVMGHYDHGIANADAAVGGLLDLLAARGLLAGATVVITADHGEAFGEHGLVEHGVDVYEALVHVPLLIHHPGQTARRDRDQRVGSANLPGLLAPGLPPLADMPVPKTVVAANRYSRPKDRHHGGRFMRTREAVYDGSLKLILSSDGDDALLDLSADPGEVRDLLADRPEDAARLRALKPVAAPLSEGTVAPSAEIEAALRALGYVE
ncbi:MAG: arylsulfatase A-like enzyme [Myxococcota bacterium]|jgi:arylsulfatase A-like enzyme